MDRDVRSEPVLSPIDGSVRGWVRLDVDRISHVNRTAFCINIECGGYLQPVEAREFARMLHRQADEADRLWGR